MTKVLDFSIIRYYGLEITIVVENFPKTNEGLMIESIFHVFNAYSSKATALHTREGMRNRAIRSLHCGGIPPLGYDVDDDTKEYVINKK